MFSAELLAAAEKLVAKLQEKNRTITVAESCTGGLLGGLLTSVAGASTVFQQGFITYSNEAKASMLGVQPDLLELYGAVSEPVAMAMASGGRHAAGADLAVSITGVAGPGGGSAEKPVGTVWFGLATNGETRAFQCLFAKDKSCDRQAVRLAALGEAVRLATTQNLQVF